MKYLYYPGCSLEGTALEYNLSTLSFMKEMGAEITEIEDWTCCGATAAEFASYLLSFVLPARNLALAEKYEEEKILVPCSSCYLNLKKVEDKFQKDKELIKKINLVLEVENLKLTKMKKVKHLLDVLVNDIGHERFKKKVKKSLGGLKIAPYYGCQCLRPFCDFDNHEKPVSMEEFIKAAGGEIYYWGMGSKCCGASHMNTKPEVGEKLITDILRNGKGADAIVTVCPMCQMNLDGFQKSLSKKSGEDLSMTILYLPQLLGYALGLNEEKLKMKMNLSITDEFKQKISA